MEKNSEKPSPTDLSYLGQACYQCSKESSSSTPLRRCSGCSRLYYCSPECQKTHWPRHKQLCKAMKTAETTDGISILTPFMILNKDPSTGIARDMESLNKCIETSSAVHVRNVERVLKRPVTPEEHVQISREPRCLACGRSETIFRIEAALERRPNAHPALERCSDCHMSFYCSSEHWEAVVDRHKKYKPGYDGLSQCATNKMSIEDDHFTQYLIRTSGIPILRWAPERTVMQFKSLRGVGWEDFMPYTLLYRTFELHPSMSPRLNTAFRAASDTLCLPMTILWALEHIYPDDSWTTKTTLNIHILGAESLEHNAGLVFEEILHRVPLVKILRLTFCGPDLPTESKEHDLETCPECTQKGRKRIHDFHVQTYHEFVAKQGGKYTKPDLAIGFNTGMSEEYIESWRKTINLLIERKIPSVFTAYNEDEAREEAQILRNAGANLDKYPDLGPMPNPWTSLKLRKEVHHITGVYARNRWLSGGFRL